MQREIKFRAWDGKHMTTFSLEIDSSGELNKLPHRHQDFPYLNLMQYTGLKDKNGKEVWEGDIVKCQQGCVHEMKWEEELGGTYGGGMPGWYLNGLIKNGGKGYAWTGDEEVIGNIYENPELLK